MSDPRRFVSVEVDGAPSWGAVVGDRFHDLGPSGAALAPDLVSVVDALPSAATIAAAPSRPVAEVRYLPVIPRPGKILCIGVNYQAHAEEGGRSRPDAPIVFTRFADTQIGHEEQAILPPETAKLDWEGEIAIVIGRRGRRVPQAEAWGLVAGFAPYNDLSVRDWQRHSTQWVPGKNWAATGGFGPALVPTEDVDIPAIELTTRVNGEVRQHAAIGDMTFSIPEIIEYVSTFTPLNPGDVIVTGTPGGVGLFMEPPTFLQPGDVVEVDVAGVGVLRNEVVAE